MLKQDVERKFLVKNDDWLLLAIPERTGNISQAYLSIEPEIRVRVNSLTPEIGYLSVLSNRVNGVRQVFDYQIPIADAIALQQTATYRLSKVRHEVKVGDQLWTVDEFEGDHDGLVIAEIKLADIPVLPDWVWREVTGDPQYSNVQLAQS